MKLFLAGGLITVLTILLLYFSLSSLVTITGSISNNTESFETLSNITELYSMFTPYMKMNVDYHIKAVNCEPDKYYYRGESICFVCENYDACFGYSWVNRDSNKKMNPNTSELYGVYDTDTIVNFYSLGLAKKLGCTCVDKCECQEGVTLNQVDGRLIFGFPEDVNKIQMVETVFHDIGLSCTFSTLNITDETIFNCEVLGGFIRSNEVIL